MKKIGKKEVVLIIIFIASILFFNIKEFRFKTNRKILIEEAMDKKAESNNVEAKENTPEKSEKEVEGPKEIKVDICGAVKNQGVVIVKEGDRLIDVINKAGGLTEKADINRFNRSKYVFDGEKIIIPEKGENIDIEVVENIGDLGIDKKVNINTASKEELMKLDGIGESIGERIIKYRRENNGFKSVEDIIKVKGIGQGKFGQIKDSIKVK